MKNIEKTLRAIDDFFKKTPRSVIDHMIEEVQDMSIEEVYIEDYMALYEANFQNDCCEGDYGSGLRFDISTLGESSISLPDYVNVASVSENSNNGNNYKSLLDLPYAA